MFGRDVMFEKKLGERKKKKSRAIRFFFSCWWSKLVTVQSLIFVQEMTLDKHRWPVARSNQCSTELLPTPFGCKEESSFYLFIYFFGREEPSTEISVLPWKQKGHQVLINTTAALIISPVISLAVFMKRTKLISHTFPFIFYFFHRKKKSLLATRSWHKDFSMVRISNPAAVRNRNWQNNFCYNCKHKSFILTK